MRKLSILLFTGMLTLVLLAACNNEGNQEKAEHKAAVTKDSDENHVHEGEMHEGEMEEHENGMHESEMEENEEHMTGSESVHGDQAWERSSPVNVKAIDENGDGFVYQDQMDWNVIADEEGRCPKCGMHLEKVSIADAEKNLKEHGYEVK